MFNNLKELLINIFGGRMNEIETYLVNQIKMIHRFYLDKNKVKKKWKNIIIHHSLTKDTVLNDFEAIKKFHTSYRIDGSIVSKSEFYSRLKRNDGKHFQKPWKDIGYHFVIEKIDNYLLVRVGRKINEIGAHTIGKNKDSIGICIVGNYDKREPAYNKYLLTAMLCRELMTYFNIHIRNIYPHRKFATYKSCPGKKFDMDKLKSLITEVRV